MRVKIDPVTRVGGHLRVDVDVADGVVRDAWTSATMYRGIERILEGRDAREAWLLAQRVCGQAGDTHALASVRAVEHALGITVPRNARLVRNLLVGTRLVVNHVTHFYHRQALDWASPLAAVRADPAAAARLSSSMSDWPKSSRAYYESARIRLATLVGSGLSGPFANGYWDHPAYRLSPEASLVVLAHYIEALDWQRLIMRVHALLGGKSPHPQTFLVGGMSLAPVWTGPRRPGSGEHPWGMDRNSTSVLGPAGLADVHALLDEAARFVDQVYVPDAIAVATAYPEWLARGRGTGDFLSFGDLPEDDSTRPALLLPAGRTMSRDLSHAAEVDQRGITETVAHAFYADESVDGRPRPPSDGVTEPAYVAPDRWFAAGQAPSVYSWAKAPRYDGDVIETGPLARMLVGYASSAALLAPAVRKAATAIGGGPELLCGTGGRGVARAVEAQQVAHRLVGWLDELGAGLASDLALADITMWDTGAWPSEAEGSAVGEGPAGMVGHWLRIRDGRIAAYQIVDGSTWNASPRDERGRRGAIEEALVGTPVADVNRPVELLRTIHSFDPCGGCAAHVWRQTGGATRARTAGADR